MPVSGPAAFSPVPHHSWHRWKCQWHPKQPAQSQTLNSSTAAAALLLPAFPSSPERSPHPAVKSHRFVSTVQGTERSRVRQQSSSLQGEVGSCCCTHRAHPNIGAGLPAPLRVWKNKILASLLIYNIHSCSTDIYSQYFLPSRGRHSHVQGSHSTFLSHFPFTIFKHCACKHPLSFPTSLRVRKLLLLL